MRTGFVKGRPLSPIMPWHSYRKMTDEDLDAVFAYLKTVPPIRHHIDSSAAPTYCKLCRQITVAAIGTDSYFCRISIDPL